MPSSPPETAEFIRHQSLSPASPRPQNVPTPANIPILVEQMDPNFTAPSSYANGTSTAQPHPSTAPSSTPSYADPSHAFDSVCAQPAQVAYYHTQPQAGSTVDVQALLDSLAPAANTAPSAHYASPHISSQSAQAQLNSSTLSAPTNLPPRPPAQDMPATHPNYDPRDDIRSYHPHSQQAAVAVPLQPLNTQRQEYSIAPPSGAVTPAVPAQPHRQPVQRSETPDDEDIRWPPEVNRKYEDFLDQERKFVTEGQWDQFPLGSRLFIGNLPTEKVTKRDIFHRFYRHGQLAQISIKQAYGFVQFLDADSCRRALDSEQGQTVRGRKMHLEVSKPQRNTKKADSQAVARRRSRSPDYSRGGTGQIPRDVRYGGSVNSMSPRERDRRFRDRDDYRPMRSPSPRAAARGVRSRDRSRDRFDKRYRSRSRTPPRRHRSPSPLRDYTEDGLDLRRRLPHEVPDIQILVLNEGLPRDFIRYVEDVFRSQNLRSNVLILSGRFPEPAVVRRQILEGVLAIVRLDTAGLTKGKIRVQIFDRREGETNIQFNEYADLDPTTAGLLVNKAKQNQLQSVQPPVQPFGFSQGLPYTQPGAAFAHAPTSQPNISNLIASLDGGSLSQLLGAMSNNNVPQSSQPTLSPGFNTDLARLLAQVPSPAQNSGFSSQSQSQITQLSTQFPALASLFASQPQQAAPSAPSAQTPTQSNGAPDMSEIMAQLSQYQR